jgi:hypothetical protein
MEFCIVLVIEQEIVVNHSEFNLLQNVTLIGSIFGGLFSIWGAAVILLRNRYENSQGKIIKRYSFLAEQGLPSDDESVESPKKKNGPIEWIQKNILSCCF